MEELGMASAPGYLFGIVEQGDEISEQVKAGCLGVTRSKQSFLACYRGRIKCVEVRHRKLWDACIALHCGQGQQLVWVERTPKAQQPSPGTLVQGTGHMAPWLYSRQCVSDLRGGSAAANLVRIRTQKQVI